MSKHSPTNDTPTPDKRGTKHAAVQQYLRYYLLGVAGVTARPHHRPHHSLSLGVGLGMGVSSGSSSSRRTMHHWAATLLLLLLWTEGPARGPFHLAAATAGRPLHQSIHQTGDRIAGGGGAIGGTCLCVTEIGETGGNGVGGHQVDTYIVRTHISGRVGWQQVVCVGWHAILMALQRSRTKQQEVIHR